MKEQILFRISNNFIDLGVGRVLGVHGASLSGAGERNPARDKVWVQGTGTQRCPGLQGFLRTAPLSTPRLSSFHVLMLGVLLCSLKASLTLKNRSLKPLHVSNTVPGGTWAPINRPEVRKILHSISCLCWLCWNYDCQFRIWNAHDCTKTLLAQNQIC